MCVCVCVPMSACMLVCVYTCACLWLCKLVCINTCVCSQGLCLSVFYNICVNCSHFSLSLSLPLPPPTPSLSADPRRPYPQDIEMRSGFLGGFSAPAPQSEVATFGVDLAPLSEPPEKKIAMETTRALLMQGRPEGCYSGTSLIQTLLGNV